jgi:hypothetical protein
VMGDVKEMREGTGVLEGMFPQATRQQWVEVVGVPAWNLQQSSMQNPEGGGGGGGLMATGCGDWEGQSSSKPADWLPNNSSVVTIELLC